MKWLVGLILSLSFTANSLELKAEQFNKIKDLSEKSYDSATGKDLKLLYFWATWCPNCKEKMKGSLKEVAKWSEAELLLISTEKDIGLVKNFVEKEEISNPVYVDATKVVRLGLGISAVPSWALLKRKGAVFEVLGVNIGFDEAAIKNLIKNQR